MAQKMINEFKVTVFNSYNGTELFSQDAAGNQIYAHKVTGDTIERAKELIALQ